MNHGPLSLHNPAATGRKPSYWTGTYSYRSQRLSAQSPPRATATARWCGCPPSGLGNVQSLSLVDGSRITATFTPGFSGTGGRAGDGSAGASQERGRDAAVWLEAHSAALSARPCCPAGRGRPWRGAAPRVVSPSSGGQRQGQGQPRAALGGAPPRTAQDRARDMTWK